MSTITKPAQLTSPASLQWPHVVAVPWVSWVPWDPWDNEAFDSIEQWCLDKLSSRGVLWKFEYNYDLLCPEFHFAQGQDAVLFRLANGV